MSRRVGAAVGAALFLGGFLIGCAPSPKYIAASTGRPGSVKFLYNTKTGGQGVIKCDRAEDGTLSNCRRMRIVLKGE